MTTGQLLQQLKIPSNFLSIFSNQDSVDVRSVYETLDAHHINLEKLVNAVKVFFGWGSSF